MVGRYEVSDLDVEDILVFAPNAHVDLGYTPYPSQFELEQEILAGVHTNPHGEIGCPVCGCIDLFLKERTAKGVRYRCMSCMYATESEFESVKSRKDITLAQFGLGFECAICGEDIDSYNHDTVMRHVRKCRQNQNQNFEAPYQPSQTLADYSPEMLKYSSTVTGDFFWDSLKFGQTTRNAEENQSDLHIWDEEAGLFYDYIEVPQPDGELIVVYWILNEELDQVGKAQISLFNNNLEIDSIFIEPYYQRRGIATSFVNHVVNYWDSELLTFSDTVSDEGVAFVDSFAAEDNYDSTYGVKQAKIRRRLKKKIKKQAIMGTKAGQWSARKSQELKRQYEAACQRAGLKPYKGQKTKKQQDLTDWSKQGWRTASGKKSSTTGEPYFPAKAVAALKQKGLYAKAKKQKQAATKAGKQNARYSDDIRKVVAKYRAEGVNMKKLDYYQNVLDKSVFPFIDIEWETGDETIAEKLTKKDYSWQDDVEWTSWTPNQSKLSKTFVFTDDDPWVELWNLVFFADALSEASGVDIESVVNQNRVQITIEKTQTPIDFVLLEYINEYMRL